MNNKKMLTRRNLSKQLGLITGLGLMAPAITLASPVTPEQVEGPFHPIEGQSDTDLDLSRIKGHTKTATGETILVRGRILDTQGQPLENALVDIWQANDAGRYTHREDPNPAALDPDFQGWGMVKTDADGRYGFRTIKPGAYPLSFLGEEGWRARHIHFKVTRPGNSKLITQMYFQGDPLLEQDLEIAKVPREHRHLLLPDVTSDEASGLPLYSFDLTLG